MYDVFIGRQPIYNQKLDVHGYELLFRGSDSHRAEIADAEQATSQVLLSAVMERGLEHVVGRHKAFVNVSRDFILNDYVTTLDKNRIVLELVDGEAIDPPLIERMKNLTAQGYGIVLGNDALCHIAEPLVKMTQMVKLNVRGLSTEELSKQHGLLRRHDVKLIAGKVEAPVEFERCDRLGFDFYQGYFLTQPNNVRVQRLPANRAMVLQLLAALQNPDADADAVEQLIAKDPFLSYRLMRYINSAYFGLPQRIDSIKRAVLLVGIPRVKNWVTLIALAKIDDKPHDLLVTALARGRMCELLAQSARRDKPAAYPIVGMFSVLDAVMDQPMAQVLAELPLTDAIRDALVGNAGDMGAALRCTIAYERGQWDEVRYGDLENSAIVDCYLRAIEWAANLGADLAVA